MTNRHVPLIWGVLAWGAAFYLFFQFQGGWRYLLCPILFLLGLGSFKVGLFASDKEIRELTTDEPMSDETKQNLHRRF